MPQIVHELDQDGYRVRAASLIRSPAHSVVGGKSMSACPEPRVDGPEPPGPLDFPISPALGSTGSFLPAGAAMVGLALFALACSPLLCPLDIALLSMQSLVLVFSWLICDAQQESAEAYLAGRIEHPALAEGPAESSLLVDGRDYPLRGVVLIGRADDCHIELDDPAVALYQAAVVAGAGRVVISNLNSAEMTVNGVRLTEGQLEAGDTVRIGSTNLICYQDGAAHPVADEGPVAALGGPRGVLRLARASLYWIGRSAACAMMVDDPGVADRHALIAVAASGTATLIDFTSPPGTRVNDLRAHFKVLSDGDVLTVGQTALTFHERV